MIKTPNLHLIPLQFEHLQALAEGKPWLGALLGVSIPDQWPTFPEAFALPETPPAQISPSEWEGYLFIHPARQTLVGNGGYKGAPDEQGTVEIGYEIAPEFWNQGYATEVVRGMLAFAFAHPAVQRVIAHTLGEKNASNSVLQKAGFVFTGAIPDEDFGEIWGWGIERHAYETA